MNKIARTAASGAFVLACTIPAAVAGGGWVPEEKDGDIQFGYSRKVANSSWNTRGQTTHNSSWHLFRYGYVGGESGLGHGLSVRYTVLYLDGQEGVPGSYESNKGLSEGFIGFKYRVHEGNWPMAVAVNARTSFLYDQAGTYNRAKYVPDSSDLDGDGNKTEAVFSGVNSEWRGLLGEDYGVTFIASHAILDGGWINLEGGYTYRTGNLADEIPFTAEIGYPTGWDRLAIKGTYNIVASRHNNSEIRQPDDRFGCSANNCFPDASRQVVGLGGFFTLGANRGWWVEAGLNHWLWGRSTRKYEEPYISLGRKF